MARNVITESRAGLVAKLGRRVIGDRETTEIRVVIVRTHGTNTTTKVGVHDAEEPSRRLKVVPKIREGAFGPVQSVVEPGEIMIQMVGAMVQFQFGTQPIAEKISADKTGRPALIEINLVEYFAVLPDVLGAFPIRSPLGANIRSVIGPSDQGSGSEQ